MSTYHDHLFIKTPKQIYSREIIKQLNYLWQDSSTYQTQLVGSGNKSKDIHFTAKKTSFEINLDTEDVIDGTATQHVDIIEEIIPAVYAARGMKELEFSGWMNVGCYIDGDCAYAEFKCKNAVLTVKKYCAPRFEMDTCPECGAEFETPLFALDKYSPKKNYICSSCGASVQAQYELKKIDLKTLANAPARERVMFGNFVQKTGQAPSPLEWLVLHKTDEKMLLLCRLGIYSCIYDDADNSAPHTWHNSKARVWLNNEFYQQAFSVEEKKLIILSVLSNKGNAAVPNAEETEDYVFLLSNDEVRKYLSQGADSKVMPTEIEQTKNVFHEWWTRSPGIENCSASLVNEKGVVDNSGLYYDKGSYLLRPAVWITASK